MSETEGDAPVVIDIRGELAEFVAGERTSIFWRSGAPTSISKRLALAACMFECALAFRPSRNFNSDCRILSNKVCFCCGSGTVRAVGVPRSRTVTTCVRHTHEMVPPSSTP